MKWATAFVFLCFWSDFALADQVLPALYDVRNVASDDHLNVRSAPSANAKIVGLLEHDSTGIEIVSISPNGKWGRVNTGEQSGWASLRFLARNHAPAGPLPLGMRCFGNEPFWSLDLRNGRSAIFETGMGADSRQVPVEATATSTNRTDRFALLAGRMSATVGLGICTDGMSGRVYGAQIDMLDRRGDSITLYSGCCTWAE